MGAAEPRRLQHLLRRGDTFHLRVRVPLDLVERLRLGEVRRSLKTTRLAEARLIAPTYTARVKEAFVAVRTNELSRDDALRLIHACFKDLEQEVGMGFRPSSTDPAEVLEQQVLSSERWSELKHEITLARPQPWTLREIEHRLHRLGVPLDEIAPEARQSVLLGVMRVLAEGERLFQYRLEEPLLPYSPSDPLLARPLVAEAFTAAPPPKLETSRPEEQGPLLAEAVSEFMRVKKSSWTRKTHTLNAQKLAYLTEFLGMDRPLAKISPADVRNYRDAVLKLRMGHHTGPRKAFSERQTSLGNHRISAKSAKLILDAAKGFFRWSVQEAHLSSNPAETISVQMPKKPKGEKVRRPFTAAELTVLFGTPVFTGCKGLKRRFEPGPHVFRDGYFWVVALGFYTGARLGELVQLHLNDVVIDHPIPHLRITEEGAGTDGSDSYKHVKTDAGVREVPLHPDLLALGFASFVAERQAKKNAGPRLFRELKLGADGQPSSPTSKWFGRLMDKAGLTDRSLVFHSFRHGLEDAFRDIQAPQYLINSVGHSEGKVSDGYGKGNSLEVKAEAVRKLALPLRIPTLLREGQNAGEIKGQATA